MENQAKIHGAGHYKKNHKPLVHVKTLKISSGVEGWFVFSSKHL